MTPARAPMTVVHVIHSLGAGGAESVLVKGQEFRREAYIAKLDRKSVV